MNWQVFFGGLIVGLAWVAWCVGNAYANSDGRKLALLWYSITLFLFALGMGIMCGGCA